MNLAIGKNEDYQYAKLRMLQFHYDCVDKYVDRADYELCEMDTDSLYLVLTTLPFALQKTGDKHRPYEPSWLLPGIYLCKSDSSFTNMPNYEC